jgi:Methyltransferase domain
VEVRTVRDDPLEPDPGFADLYASLPDATDLEPWLGWCRQARGPVLYLGVGVGRLAVPLHLSGVEIIGVDAHPGMLARAGSRLPGVELVLERIEDLELGRRFDLVVAPSNILDTPERLAAAALHARRRVAFELVNPHWLGAGGSTGVRLRATSHDHAEIEVDYEGGFTQLASVNLIWPEAVETFLENAGLELEVMQGHDDGGLAESPSFFVLARAGGRQGLPASRLRSAQTPST